MTRRLTLALLVAAAPSAADALAQEFVVANRGSGDVTIFDRDGAVLATMPLPAGAAAPEPMYVLQVGDEFLVGDRGNDRVVRFDRETYAVTGTVPAGAGVFHMWANFGQLWVNNDVANTVSVVDTDDWSTLATVPIPADLVALGFKPHDVYVDEKHAFVSLLGGSGNYDWVLQFDRTTFKEKRRMRVGKDPHLWVDPWADALYVATQGGNGVHVLDRETLEVEGRLSQPGAHGIFVPSGTRALLTTNIGTAGAMGLFAHAIDADGGLTIGSSSDVPASTPHNIAASRFGQRIFVTHSGGSATRVSIYELGGTTALPQLTFIRAVDAGTNPFGLAVLEG